MEECDCGWCGNCRDQVVRQQEMEAHGDDAIWELFRGIPEEDE